MPLKQTIDSCFDVEVGEAGLSRDDFEAVLARTEAGLVWLREARESGALPLLSLPGRTDDLAEIAEAATWLSEGTSDVIVLGTGGSSLGGQTLAQVGGWHLPVSGDFRDAPRLHFLDNLDPYGLADALSSLPLETTRALVVSKSGGTGETLIQTMALLSAFEDAGLKEKIGDRVLGLSEPAISGRLNKLRKPLEPFDVRFLEHDPGVGGRFSVLTNVGLIPAVIAGLDL